MIPYIGGKSALASWIIENFPKDFQQKVYCEVFGGGGWVLFKKDESYLEIYNDLNKNLVNLFKVIRDDYKKFEHKCQWSLHSREMYMEARQRLKDDKFLNNLERAMHYAIIKAQGFSGKEDSWGYAVTINKVFSGRWLPFLKRLQAINARLKRVQIECLEYEKCIEKYDAKNTLFYLDPPYVGVEHYYNLNDVYFGADDHIKLAEIIKKIDGKFVLSYYENKLIRKLYKDYRIIKKHTSKSSAGIIKTSKIRTRPKAVELLIMNY